MVHRAREVDVRTVLVVAVGFVLGLALTAGSAALWPQADFVAFIFGFLTFAVVPPFVGSLGGRRWVGFAAFAAAAFAAGGAWGLPAELALDQSGDRVEARVVDHAVTHPWVSGQRTTHHTYTLRRGDGRSLQLSTNKRSGYGIDTGDTVTVLVDPGGEVPPKLAAEVDPGAGLVAFCLGVAGMGLLLTVTVLRRGRPSIAQPGLRT